MCVCGALVGCPCPTESYRLIWQSLRHRQKRTHTHTHTSNGYSQVVYFGVHLIDKCWERKMEKNASKHRRSRRWHTHIAYLHASQCFAHFHTTMKCSAVHCSLPPQRKCEYLLKIFIFFTFSSSTRGPGTIASIEIIFQKDIKYEIH